MSPEKTEEEVLSADRIVGAMVKAAKGIAIYPPGSSFHGRFFGDLHKALGEHLESYGALALEIERYEMRFASRAVYENRNPKDSLAFRIHADGITSLEFREGLSLEEIESFLLILNSRGGEESDDDMATLLWAADLPHVSYELEDDLDQMESPLAGKAQEPEEREEALQRAARAEAPPAMDSPLRRETAADILALTEDEERFLAKAIAFEEGKNPLDDILGILPATLHAGETESFKGEILDLTGTIASRLLAEGLMDHVLALLGILKGEAERRDGPGELAARAAAALESVGNSPDMESPEGFLQAAGSFGAGKIVELLGLLGPGASGPFCLLLDNPLDETTEHAITEALAAAARTRADVFLPHLSGGNPVLAKKILSILRRAGSPAGAPKLPALVAAGDTSLQRETIAYIGELAVPGGEGVLISLMDNENSGIRIHAARALAAGSYAAPAERIIATIASPSFRERGPAERKAFFEIVGGLGGEKALAFLTKSLAARYPFARKKERDEVLSAAAGLQKMAAPEALAALRKERDGRKGELRDTLDGIIGRAERAAAGKGDS